MTRISIGITVFNRKKTLERMIASLFASDLNVIGLEYTIRVYDDCSTEFDEDEVRALFPVRIEYYRHEKNHGADYNMGYMYRDFLKHGDDILFNCDSDLIFDKFWLNALIKYLPQTDGILSLFNTKTHSISEVRGDLCIKSVVGNAGTVMTRSAVELICNNTSEKESYNAFEYNWSSLFKNTGKSIFSTCRSYVQHIGIDGYNSSQGAIDIGDDFRVSDSVNGQILGDVLFEVISTTKTNGSLIRPFVFLFPFDRIPKGKKVIIYGAGTVGRDYKKQVEMCEYCSALVLVDKAYSRLRDVSPPEVLKESDYDYIVTAAHFGHIRDEMRKDILKINPDLENRIVSDVCYSIRL